MLSFQECGAVASTVSIWVEPCWLSYPATVVSSDRIGQDVAGGEEHAQQASLGAADSLGAIGGDRFMFRRKKSRKDEINEALSAGVGHLREAASATAGAASDALGQAKETIGEKLAQTKQTVSDKVAQQREAADNLAEGVGTSSRRAERKARKKVAKRLEKSARQVNARRRWPRVLGVLAVGAAIGAAASALTRRARKADWKEFDVREQAEAAKNKLGEAASAAKDKASLAGQKAAEVAKDTSVTVKDRASHFANVVRQKATLGKDNAGKDVDAVGAATGTAIDAANAIAGKTVETADKVAKKTGKSVNDVTTSASRNGRTS